MKRICVFILALLPAFVLANAMIPGPQPKPLPTPVEKMTPVDPDNAFQVVQSRVAPQYSFTKLPTAIITNYYDYMIGSYNGLPLRVIPEVAGGGYFMTYHGRRQPTSTRRAFYTYLDASGNVINNNEITSVQKHEGYATVAVDPVSGKPLYAWHANTDDDGELEVEFTSDAFLGGISGLFNPTQNAIDNPITMTAPDGTVTEVNDFDWPTAQIGPSPVAGKRRIYLAARNSETQTYGPSENLMLAYADFNDYDIENGIPFVWNHTSIPEMNQWNVDEQWRRPFHAITTDNAGNVYYAGYHFATESDGSTNIREADMDVFRCPNYGEGTWTRISDYSWIPTWNPIGVKDSTGHYFVGDDYPDGYPDSLVVWALANSSHINAVMDNNGRLHVFGNWAMSTKDGGYWQDYQVVKEFVYDPANETFQVKEVFPQKDPADTFNQCFVPWDMEAPWGEAEYFDGGDGNFYLTIAAAGGGHPGIKWPFPHWDDAANDAMMFYYNNNKVTEANEQGMMAAVWQDSQRARWFNYETYEDYAAFANTPEIFISVSGDNGETWSEPIIINNVETPEFAGIKPMYVYPADKVIYTGMQGDNKVGKLGLMFYNDFTWGSASIDPPYHYNQDGGEVMFMELQIWFSGSIEPPIILAPLDPIVMYMDQNHFLDGLDQYFHSGDPQAIYSLTGNTHIGWSGGSGNSITLIPETGWYGTEYVNLRLTDSQGQYVEQTVMVTVLQTWSHTEDFDHGGSLPHGWSTTHSGTTGYPWQPYLVGGTDYGMKTMSTTGGTANERLISPAFDLSGLEDVQVAFDTAYLPYGAGTGTFAYSLNGITYLAIETFGVATNGIKTYSLPELNGIPSVRFRWTYYNSSASIGEANHWTVDDFNIMAVYVDTTPPAQMEEFFVQAVSADAIQLAWSASSDTDFAGYRVYYDDDPAVGTEDNLWDWYDDPGLENAGSGLVGTTITGLEAATRYYFLLQAVDLLGNITQHPNIITGMTSSIAAPLAPQSLTVTLEGSLLSLDWEDVTQDELGNPITVSYYEVHVSDLPFFACSNETLVDTVLTSELALEGVVEPADRLFFKVIAVSGAIRDRGIRSKN